MGAFDYRNFCQLIKKGESSTVDFKIDCKAFTKDSDKEKAELLKDIIAMSNNGYKTSYILIGVSDDGKEFKSFTNHNFTDDHLQRLCRDNIQPMPIVELYDLFNPNKCKPEHQDKKFTIIIIGRQHRQCFRFARDNINYSKEYCFRKNEVWLRRGSTSDLASPEEAARLVAGKTPIHLQMKEEGVNYLKLPRDKIREKIFIDLERIFSDLDRSFTACMDNEITYRDGGLFIYRKDRAQLNFLTTWGYLNLNVQVAGVPITQSKFYFLLNWGGIRSSGQSLLICTGNFAENATEHYNIALKEDWGWLCMQPRIKPEEFDKFAVLIVMTNVKNTNDLDAKLHKMIDSVSKSRFIKALADNKPK